MGKKVLLVFLLPVIISLPACGLAAIGAGAGAATGMKMYNDGEVRGVYREGFDQSVAAVEVLLADLGMPMSKAVQKDDITTIKSKFVDGESVTILVKKLDRKTTQIGFRVGVMGDEPKAEYLLRELEKRLL